MAAGAAREDADGPIPSPAPRNAATPMGPTSRFICAVDDAPTADDAVVVAGDLAARLGARLTLCHVAHRPSDFPYGDQAAMERRHAAALAEGEQLLRDVAGRTGVEATLRVACGEPAPVLLELAEQMAADLVVVGSHGHGALHKALLGSTSAALARRLACPLVVVPQGGAAAYREAGSGGHPAVVIGADGTPESHAALACADNLAAGLGARLVVVGAAAPLLVGAPSPMVPGPYGLDRAFEQSEELAEERVQEARRHVHAASEVETGVESGPLAAVLVDAAERAEAQLVVTASDTGSGLFGHPGSVQWQRLATASARPVVVVGPGAGGELVDELPVSEGS